jgi:hypothetical protein
MRTNILKVTGDTQAASRVLPSNWQTMRDWEKKQTGVDNESFIVQEIPWPLEWGMEGYKAFTGSDSDPEKTVIRVQDPFIALAMSGLCHPGVALAHKNEVSLQPKVVMRQVRYSNCQRN